MNIRELSLIDALRTEEEWEEMRMKFYENEGVLYDERDDQEKSD